VDFIDLIVERQIAEAIERGELDSGPLSGCPIADLDTTRQQGWWAEQFVRKERSRLAREEALEELGSWRRRFWRAASEAELVPMVAEANERIAHFNLHLIDVDALPAFDVAKVITAWRSLR
jgi:hypothetical protein